LRALTTTPDRRDRRPGTLGAGEADPRPAIAGRQSRTT